MMDGIFFTDKVSSISTLREEIKDYVELINSNHGLLKNSQTEIKYIMDKEQFQRQLSIIFQRVKPLYLEHS